ncbi:MAG: HEAT repeat domain-containing protein [Methanotrichaceae archaeon]|nr:HEAT repeat domain-containing protein [Methanotrichaceae archaeon]
MKSCFVRYTLVLLLMNTILAELVVSENLEYYKQAFNNPDPSARIKVIKILGSVVDQDPEALDLIAQYLNDSDADVKETALESIDLIGRPHYATEPINPKFVASLTPRVVSMLIQALNNSDPTVRSGIVEVLGKYSNLKMENNNSRIADSILRVFRDTDPYVRMSVTRSTITWSQNFEDKIDLIDFLALAINDTDSTVRAAAVNGLRKLRSPKANYLLIQALKDPDPNVRLNAVVSIEDIVLSEDTEFVDPLIVALNDTNPDIRMYAASALGKLKDSKAAYPLSQSIKDPVPSVRISAGLALAAIGKTGLGFVEDPLIELLKDKDPNIRSISASLLGNIQTSKVIPPLIQSLNDSDHYVRSVAASALGKLKDPIASGPLIQALNDTDDRVRKNAAIALGEIGDSRVVGSPLNGSCNDNNESLHNIAKENSR